MELCAILRNNDDERGKKEQPTKDKYLRIGHVKRKKHQNNFQDKFR